MEQAFLYYPVRNPINQSNLFGANPAAYAPLKQKGHPGLDFICPTGTQIFAAHDGQAFYVSDSLGGDGLWERVTDSDGNNLILIYYHMPTLTNPPPVGVTSAATYPFQIKTDGSLVAVKAGQFLGYTDNSGYHPTGVSESNAPHFHFGVMPCDKNWAPLYPENGFLGCVDPTAYFNGLYAQDIVATPATQAIAPVVEAADTVVQEIAASNLPTATKLSFFQKVAQILKQLLNIHE